MDTQTIAAYYTEIAAMKRKKHLDRSIQDNEDPEGNQIRQELWNIRYSRESGSSKGDRADGFMGLWMALEFNRGSEKKLFGGKRARKEVVSALENLHFQEYMDGDDLHRQLFYRECLHMVKMYIGLCKTDKGYGSAFGGLIPMKEENVNAKIRVDIYETGICAPRNVGLEKELDYVIRAAREAYSICFPDEEPLPD